MAIQTSDIKIYLTGLAVNGTNADGSSAQTNPNLSLGGFRSSTEVNQSTVLSSDISSTATTIEVDDISKLQGASSLYPAYAVIGNELISYTARSTSLGAGYLLGVTRGVFGREASSHTSGDVITAVTSQNLFDHVRAAENLAGDTEYRCFAVLNTNSADTAYNVKVYLSPIIYTSTATSATADEGSGGTLTDNTLIGEYADDYFNSGTLEILSGTGYSELAENNLYTVTDYIDSTGTFTISEGWNNGTPDFTTSYKITSQKASPNHNDTISFCIERHYYSKLDGSGIATDGGQTYLVDDSLPGAGWTSPLHFVGAYILLLTGDGVDGIPKKIVTYNASTGRIDIDGTFVNTGASAGDLFTIVRGPTSVQVASEGVAPPAGSDNLSDFSTATSLSEALSINVNDIGEDLSHDELFFVWVKRVIAANTDSYTNDNIIPVIYFES